MVMPVKMARNSENIFSEFARPLHFAFQSSSHTTMEGSKSKSSKQLTEWTVEDVSQIIREQYNDEVAKKFEGQ